MRRPRCPDCGGRTIVEFIYPSPYDSLGGVEAVEIRCKSKCGYVYRKDIHS